MPACLPPLLHQQPWVLCMLWLLLQAMGAYIACLQLPGLVVGLLVVWRLLVLRDLRLMQHHELLELLLRRRQ